jgi:hypothetical protein
VWDEQRRALIIKDESSIGNILYVLLAGLDWKIAGLRFPSPFWQVWSLVTTDFASLLTVTHLAGVVCEPVAVLGVFAVDRLTGQVLARMDKRERNKLAKAA